MVFIKKYILLTLFLLSVNLIPAQNYIESIKNLKAKPDNIEKFVQLADIYKSTGYLQKAIFYYRKALELKPDKHIKQHLAKVYDQYGQPTKAIALRRQILQQDSTDYLTKYRLAVNYAQIKQKDTALRLLEELIQIDPANPNYYYKSALYEIDINKKLDYLLQAYRRDAKHKKTLYLLIQYYKQIQFLDSSDVYLNKGLQVYPNDTKFLRLKVIADYRHKNYQNMLKSLKLLDSLHYNPLFVNKNLALSYLHLKQYKKVSYHLDKALKMDHRDPILYYYYGLLYERKNLLNKAKKHFNIAIRLKKPKLDQEYFELGMIAKKQKQYQLAINYFNKALKNNTQHANALFQKAILLDEVLKKHQKALHLYKKYISGFKEKDPVKTHFAQQKIKALKLKLFLNK